MFSLALSRLVLDWRRSLAALLTVLFAVTSFVVLTGTTSAQQVDVLRTADSTYRSSYDVLVRPAGSRSALESATGRVRPNFLSDTYGGITLEQASQLASIPGVEVSAPIATVGMIWAPVEVPVDLTRQIRKSGTQLFRIATVAQSRGGFAMPSQSAYLYVTDNPIRPAQPGKTTGPVEQADGISAYPCLSPQHSGGERRPDSPFDAAARFWGYCMSRQDPDAVYAGILRISIPVMVAAIDPDAEAALVGLDATVRSGRYLNSDDALARRPAAELGSPRARQDAPVAPALLAASAPPVDYGVRVTVDELSTGTVKQLLDARYRADQLDVVAAAKAVRQVSRSELPLNDLYRRLVDAKPPAGQPGSAPGEIWTVSVMRPGSVQFETGAGLTAKVQDPDLQPYKDNGWNSVWDPVPGSVADSSYRTVEALSTEKVSHFGVLVFQVVGTFEPSRTVVGSPLSQVPLETYRSGAVSAEDAPTAEILGGNDFHSNLNPADYLMTQPTILIPLKAVGIVDPKYVPRLDPAATDIKAPISAVRVRVADVTGWDRASQERVRLVAQQIHDRTGLDVDITIGSALVEQSVTLPQTGDRPDLQLTEHWSLKGVVTAIVTAVDRKSMLLFGLILISCSLTIATIAQVAVQAQRTDLGVLSAVGQPPGRIRLLLILQQSMLGTAAGIGGALLSWPLGSALGVPVDGSRSAAAVPVAVGLTLLASLPAARHAARTLPTDLLKPPVRATGRSLPVDSAMAMGVVSIVRRPWRLVRAAASIALAVAPMGMLLAIAWTFQGAVVGTLLGEVVALQVRSADLIAGGVLAALGLLCVSMTLTFGALKDAADWAVLAAIGWQPRRIIGAVLIQGAAIGLLGALVGSLAAWHWLPESPGQIQSLSARPSRSPQD